MFFYFYSSLVTDPSSGSDYDAGGSSVSAMIRYYSTFYSSQVTHWNNGTPQVQSDLDAANSVTVKANSLQPNHPDAPRPDSDVTSTGLLPFDHTKLAKKRGQCLT